MYPRLSAIAVAIASVHKGNAFVTKYPSSAYIQRTTATSSSLSVATSAPAELEEVNALMEKARALEEEAKAWEAEADKLEEQAKMLEETIMIEVEEQMMTEEEVVLVEDEQAEVVAQEIAIEGEKIDASQDEKAEEATIEVVTGLKETDAQVVKADDDNAEAGNGGKRRLSLREIALSVPNQRN